MGLINPTLLFNAIVSGSTIVNSDPLNSQTMHLGGMSIKWGNGLNAIFNLQASLDGIDYGDYDVNGIIIPASTGTAGFSIINIPDIGLNFFRIQIIPTSGSALVTVKGSMKR